eukprot:6663178-Ditylum_brightwellii.AAC.2
MHQTGPPPAHCDDAPDTDSTMAQEEAQDKAELFSWDNIDDEDNDLMTGLVTEVELRAQQEQAAKAGKWKNSEANTAP